MDLERRKAMSNLKTLKEIFVQPTRPNKLYCNVPGVYFIWHGSWSDPEVMYQDKLFNLPTDIETPLYGYYCDDCKAKGIEEDEDDFAEWVENNPDDVYEILNSLIEAGIYKEV